ncbi:MAG TPA: chemotaxis protein CheW [Dehalococcoidia bacterium]
MSTAELLAQDEQVVAFHLGNERYGVEITAIQEIIQVGTVTPIPNAPAYLEGVTNLRGRIIPVVNLRHRLGMPPAEHTERTRIIVVTVDGTPVGLVVDAVSEVMRIPQADIEPPSVLVTLPDDDLVRGIGKTPEGLISLVNLRSLVGGL